MDRTAATWQGVPINKVGFPLRTSPFISGNTPAMELQTYFEPFSLEIPFRSYILTWLTENPSGGPAGAEGTTALPYTAPPCETIYLARTDAAPPEVLVIYSASSFAQAAQAEDGKRNCIGGRTERLLPGLLKFTGQQSAHFPQSMQDLTSITGIRCPSLPSFIEMHDLGHIAAHKAHPVQSLYSHIFSIVSLNITGLKPEFVQPAGKHPPECLPFCLVQSYRPGSSKSADHTYRTDRKE